MDRVDIRKRIISNQKKVEVLTELIDMLKENIKEDLNKLQEEVKNEDDNAQVKANEGNSKYTVIDGITIKDIFKYEARFSASDEFDELW